MSKKGLISSMLFNSANFFIGLICIISYFITFNGGFHFVKSNCLAYFTNLSAILAAVSSAFIALFCLKNLEKAAPLLPKWMSVLKLMAASAEMLTFAVVLCMQLPAAGLRVYYGQDFFSSSHNACANGDFVCRF